MKNHIDRKAFRKALKQAGMTQGKAAERAGMSQNSLSRKVLGQRDFLLQEIIALCKVLHITDHRPIFAPELTISDGDASGSRCNCTQRKEDEHGAIVPRVTPNCGSRRD